MEDILLIFIALGEDLVHFPQGSKLWLGSCFGKIHNSLYKINHDAYETLKRSLTHTHPLFINSSEFGIICEAISDNYPRELEPQFASKDSYFEQNIKKVFGSNWEVKKNKLAWYLSYIIIHVPSKKIWNHLGQFGGLDIKISQEPKLWKNWKIGNFGKNLKRGN